jgi:hypothetical protein
MEIEHLAKTDAISKLAMSSSKHDDFSHTQLDATITWAQSALAQIEHLAAVEAATDRQTGSDGAETEDVGRAEMKSSDKESDLIKNQVLVALQGVQMSIQKQLALLHSRVARGTQNIKDYQVKLAPKAKQLLVRNWHAGLGFATTIYWKHIAVERRPMMPDAARTRDDIVPFDK